MGKSFGRNEGGGNAYSRPFVHAMMNYLVSAYQMLDNIELIFHKHKV